METTILLAQALFYCEMPRLRIEPTLVSFNSAINTCATAGLWQAASVCSTISSGDFVDFQRDMRLKGLLRKRLVSGKTQHLQQYRLLQESAAFK